MDDSVLSWRTSCQCLSHGDKTHFQAFVLMNSFHIHCRLITFLNHHQAHVSLLWILFMLDFRNYELLYVCSVFIVRLSYRCCLSLPYVLEHQPIWHGYGCVSERRVHVGCHVASCNIPVIQHRDFQTPSATMQGTIFFPLSKCQPGYRYTSYQFWQAWRAQLSSEQKDIQPTSPSASNRWLHSLPLYGSSCNT